MHDYNELICIFIYNQTYNNIISKIYLIYFWYLLYEEKLRYFIGFVNTYTSLFVGVPTSQFPSFRIIKMR